MFRVDRRAVIGVFSWLIGGAVAVAAVPAHARADKPRIAVLWIAADKLAPDVRVKLEAAVVGGLAASGADVAGSAEAARRVTDKGLAGCETPTCLAGIGQALGAQFLVRGTVEAAGGRYDIRLEMIDGVTGAVIEMREDRCEICTEVEAYETASIAASALKAQVSKRRGTPASGGATSAVAAAPADAPPFAAGKPALAAAPAAPPPLVVAADGSAPAPPQRGRALPWVGMGAGAVAVAAGIYLIALDGEGTCQHNTDQLCEFHYRTKTGGAALLGAGVLAAAASAAFLVWRY